MGVDELPKITINYKGIFDFGEIYGLVHDFLEENEYTYPGHKSGPKDLYEVEYIEKGESPRQYQITWKSEKKSDEFFTARINVNFRGTDISKTEIMHEGKKVKVDSGDIVIEIKSEFETDYSKATEKHPFVKHFKSKFEGMVKDLKKGSKESFEGNVSDLHNLIKRYFKMRGDTKTAEVAPVRKG